MPQLLQPAHVVERIPPWLELTEEQFSIAIPLLSTAYQGLLQASKRDEAKFYSNEMLAKTVNKIAECKGLLSRLHLEEKDLSERKKSYRKSYEDQRFQFLKKTASISDQRQNLILQLQQWQQKALHKFQEAEKKFDEIQLKSKKMKIKLSKQVAAEIFKCFSKDYGDVAKFIYDEEDNVESIIGVGRMYADMRNASNEELKQTAGLIQDTTLIQLANEFAEAETANQNKYHHYYSIKPSWLKPVDVSACKEMAVQANELSRLYHHAAEKLSKESHGVYDRIDKKERELRLKMLRASRAIRQARIKCEKFFARVIKPTVNDCRIIISVYEEYEKKVAAAQDQYDELEKQFLSIKADYIKAGERFGVYRERTVDHLEYRVKRRLHNNVNKAAKVQVWHSGDVYDYKVKVAQAELLELIKNAITNNVEFWHKQISVFGSSSKIGTVAVPRGIAKIHNQDLCRHNSTEEILLAIKKTVGDRIAYGVGNWYARRTLSTTDVIYNRLFKLLDKLDGLTLESVQEFKQVLIGMGLVDLDSPSYNHGCSDKTELSYEFHGKDICMRLSDFLMSKG